MRCAKQGKLNGGGDGLKKKREKTLFDTLRENREDKRTDTAEGKLSKRENSAGQNGEDF
jgi:hypothetical protein